MKSKTQLNWYKKAIFVLSATTLLSTTLLIMAAAGMPLPGNPVTITPEAAESFKNNYRSTAVPLNDTVNAVIVERGQLDALNLIAKQYASTMSFRMYMAKDDSGKDVSVIVGIMPDGKDMTIPIYCVDRSGGGICPPMCSEATGDAGTE